MSFFGERSGRAGYSVQSLSFYVIVMSELGLNVDALSCGQNTGSATFFAVIICHSFYCTEPKTPLCSSSIGKYRLRLLPHAMLPISSI